MRYASGFMESNCGKTVLKYRFYYYIIESRETLAAAASMEPKFDKYIPFRQEQRIIRISENICKMKGKVCLFFANCKEENYEGPFIN